MKECCSDPECEYCPTPEPMLNSYPPVCRCGNRSIVVTASGRYLCRSCFNAHEHPSPASLTTPNDLADLADSLEGLARQVSRMAVSRAVATPVERPDVEGIRARAEAATPGPWVRESHNLLRSLHPAMSRAGYSGHLQYLDGSGWEHEGDLDFIAHARTDVPQLLDYIAQLEASLRGADQSGSHDPLATGNEVPLSSGPLHSTEETGLREQAGPGTGDRIAQKKVTHEGL